MAAAGHSHVGSQHCFWPVHLLLTLKGIGVTSAALKTRLVNALLDGILGLRAVFCADQVGAGVCAVPEAVCAHSEY